jgi:hypothetical protein
MFFLLHLSIWFGFELLFLLLWSALSPLCGSERHIQLSECANHSVEASNMEKVDNMTLPKAPNISITETKDTEMVEMPDKKIQKFTLKNYQLH